MPLSIRMLAIKSIESSGTVVQQRRRAHYDEAALKELADNIKTVQVIEPIIVRPRAAGDGESFAIIAGERRWHASRIAGLDSIPTIIRALDDQQMLEIQLVENLHREGLIGYVGNLSCIPGELSSLLLRESPLYSQRHKHNKRLKIRLKERYYEQHNRDIIQLYERLRDLSCICHAS